MKMILLAAGAVAVALTAGSAFAARKSATVAGPSQPIPYSELNAYLKASPKQRASKDWWSQASAATGTSANTSATVSATPSLPADTAPKASSAPTVSAPALPSNPPIDTPPATTVNPPNPAAPGSPETATPPK